MQHRVSRFIVVTIPVTCIVAVMVIVNTTTPIGFGPLGVLLVFALLYGLLASLVYIVLYLGAGIFSSFFGERKFAAKKTGLIACVVAVPPVFLLALHSIGQLDVKDFALILLFVIVAVFYVLRRRSETNL